MVKKSIDDSGTVSIIIRLIFQEILFGKFIILIRKLSNFEFEKCFFLNGPELLLEMDLYHMHFKTLKVNDYYKVKCHIRPQYGGQVVFAKYRVIFVHVHPLLRFIPSPSLPCFYTFSLISFV